MVKKFFLQISLIVCLFSFWVFPIQAANEFTTNYDTFYDVGSDGITTVSETITLKNLTDKYYATSFTLSIGATQISDVSAVDDQGPLVASAKQQGQKTDITVQFTQQLAGKGKAYSFKLVYKSKDFAQNIGKVWQVSIPKITAVNSLDTYQIALQIPESFGEQTSILPPPISFSQNDDKITYHFYKDQLTQSGILASYGSEQSFALTLRYDLVNDNILPKIENIPLPPDTSNQQIVINAITPKPENVTIDGDGNYIAQFKLNGQQHKQILVNGAVKLNAKQNTQFAPLSEIQQKQYTSTQPFWNSDNPQLLSKLSDILKDQQVSSTRDKAKLIYKFVVNTLQYDDSRIKNNDFQRLGAVTILNNPTKALCTDFSDLFIALARAAGIPSRELIGYAYTTNTDLRPLSFDKNLLHVWVEYYDPDLGWVMVDPTWENTTGGVDYFNQFDLNHIVFATRGESSIDPTPFVQSDVSFTGSPIIIQNMPKVSINIASTIYAGFPETLNLRIDNVGVSQIPSTALLLSDQKLELSGIKNFATPIIPPFGYVSYNYDARTHSLLQSFDDNIHVQFGDKSFDKKISIKPFFANSFFSIITIILIISILWLYIWLVLWHKKSPRSFKIKVPKEEV